MFPVPPVVEAQFQVPTNCSFDSSSSRVPHATATERRDRPTKSALNFFMKFNLKRKITIFYACLDWMCSGIGMRRIIKCQEVATTFDLYKKDARFVRLEVLLMENLIRFLRRFLLFRQVLRKTVFRLVLSSAATFPGIRYRGFFSVQDSVKSSPVFRCILPA